MSRHPVVPVALLALVAACRPSGPTLRTDVQTAIAQSGAKMVGVYYHNLTRPDSLLINADYRMHAASTMKVPVMIQLFRDIDAGKLSLDDSVLVTNTFHSIVDSSVYHLDPGDDSDSTLYRRVGTRVPVGELIDLMITVSSNLATNNLIALANPKRVQATMRMLGADSIAVLRGVEDIKAFNAGLNNTTTARDLGVILTAIAENRAASPASCKRMEDILSAQEFNSGIPAGLPPGTRVAHKTGWITGIHHDAAIVFSGDRPHYVLVILTQGLDSLSASSRLMADITRFVNAAAR
ncbi:MAG TPA: serine hydrolase [Gemmatimonadales bacterium]|nr:serine hydrolase [Gemmatimonadales bacterium]